MFIMIGFIVFILGTLSHGEVWNTTQNITAWETYLQLGDIRRPLGLALDRTSIAHRHFATGYLCLHSFMYDEANQAFDLAINANSTVFEAHLGKMLSCKYPLWGFTDVNCGIAAYNSIMGQFNNSNLTDFQSKFLFTVYQWYSNASNIQNGEIAFLSAIKNLSLTYPNETDIYVWLGLSLLNIANQFPYRSQPQPAYMIDARRELESAFKMEPSHPGVLHYLIHAYDVAQLDVAIQAYNYTEQYANVSPAASHAQHMSSHIWMRIGLWQRALLADTRAITVSLELCWIKLLTRNISISSIQLDDVLNQLNDTLQQQLLKCDAENRAHSMDWLSYSRMQMGDWLGNLQMIQDLYTSQSRSTLTPNHYISFAYQAQARTILELFYWFPYSVSFINKSEQLLSINGSRTLVSIGDNTTQTSRIWGDAGFRFSDCVRLLMMTNSSDNKSSTINDHITRLQILSNKVVSLNSYMSTSILMMISQIRGIQFYLNGSYENCLTELYGAFYSDQAFTANTNIPSLLFSRPAEMLATHMLLIYKKLSPKSRENNYPKQSRLYLINYFPSQALYLFQKANETAPNRVINTLGMARANAQLGNITEAVKLYRAFLAQTYSSNNSDPIFFNEARAFIEANPPKENDAHKQQFYFYLTFISFFLLLLQ